MLPRLRARLLAGAALLTPGFTLGLPAPAQAQTDAPQPGLVLPELNVTGEAPAAPYAAARQSTGARFALPPSELPQSIQTVTEDELRQRGAGFTGDAVSGIPSLQVTGSRATPWPSRSFLLRGLPTRVLRDGAVDRYFADIDPSSVAQIERFEVLKGPAGTGFGVGTFGGVINQITRRPQATPSYGLTGILGEYGRVQGIFDATGPLNESGSLRYRFIGDLERTDLWQDRMRLNRGMVHLGIEADLSDRARLYFQTEFQARDLPRYAGLPLYRGSNGLASGIVPVDRRLFISDPGVANIHSWGDLNRLWGEFDLAPGWQLHTLIGTTGFNTSYGRINPGLVDPATGLLPRTYNPGYQWDRDLQVNAYVTGEFSTGARRHRIAFGIDNEFIWQNWYNYGGTAYGGAMAPLNVFSPRYGVALPSYDVARLNNVSGPFNYNQHAVYLQGQFELTETLKILAGVRRERVTYDETRQLPDARYRAAYNRWSWNAGVTWEFTPGITAFAGHATGFDPFNVLTATRRPGSGPFTPEESDQTEIGLKFNLGSRFSGSAALFRTIRRNVLTPDPFDSAYSVQTGEQRIRGFELEGSVAITPELSARFGYAYQDAVITASNQPTTPAGSRIANVPRHTITSWMMYEPQGGVLRNFSFGGGVRWATNRFGNDQNSYTIGGYTVVDLTMGYRITEGLRVDAFLLNALNREYNLAGSTTSYTPGDPRTFFVRVASRF